MIRRESLSGGYGPKGCAIFPFYHIGWRVARAWPGKLFFLLKQQLRPFIRDPLEAPQ
jgi:hypothetical protein